MLLFFCQPGLCTGTSHVLKKIKIDGLRIRAVPRAGKEAYAWKRKERGPDDGSRKMTGFAPPFPWLLQEIRKKVKTKIPVP